MIEFLLLSDRRSRIAFPEVATRAHPFPLNVQRGNRPDGRNRTGSEAW
jgi:hypothetical protein